MSPASQKMFVAAAIVSCAFAGVVRAEDVLQAPRLSLYPQATYLDDMSMPARAPLMAALDRIGVARPLDDARLNLYGYVEG